MSSTVQGTSADSAPIFALRGFGAGFGSRVVLAEIDLALAPRGLVAVMGPMGGGKSTLLRVASGLAQRSANLKLWGDAEYLGAPLGERGFPGFVAQSAQMLVSSVFENLVSGMADRATLKQTEQRQRIADVLFPIGCGHLCDVLNEPAMQLSRRDQRLLPILRLIVGDLPMICVDEPTNGLDDEDSAQVMRVLRHRADSHVVLMATHHQRQVRTYADRVVLLASGRIQEDGGVVAFFERPVSAAAREFVDRGTCDSPSPDATAEELAEGVTPPPPLPEVAKRAMSAWSGPRGFVWLEPGRLAGTPRPGIVESLDNDLDALVRVGVTRLLSLLEQPLDCTDALAARGLVAQWEAVPDMAAPELSQAVRICEGIDRWLGEGQVVAVHCRAGHGRTGTVLAAYRIWRGASAVEALDGVRKLESRWIQSAAQVEFLAAFSRHMRTLRGRQGTDGGATVGTAR